LQDESKDYNPIIVILFLLIGFLIKLNLNLNIDAFLTILILLTAFILIGIIGLIPFKIGEILKHICLVIVNIISYFFIPLCSIFIACKLIKYLSTLSVTFNLNLNKSKRTICAIPLIVTIMIFSIYSFGEHNYYFPPGMIIPHQLRHNWADKQFHTFYERAIEEIEKCSLIPDKIGKIKAVTIAEGKTSFSFDLDGDDWMALPLEVVGEKGIFIVRGCENASYCEFELSQSKVRWKSKLNEQKIYYGQCKESN
jgi:hypothetical protein